MWNLVRSAGLLYDGKLLEKSQLHEHESSLARSHCIFVLSVRGIDIKTQTEVYSKINLVDLAGS